MDTNSPHFVPAPADAWGSAGECPPPLERKPWRRPELTVLPVEKTRHGSGISYDGTTEAHS